MNLFFKKITRLLLIRFIRWRTSWTTWTFEKYNFTSVWRWNRAEIEEKRRRWQTNGRYKRGMKTYFIFSICFFTTKKILGNDLVS